MIWASNSVCFTVFQVPFNIRCDTSSTVMHNDKSHYTTNVQVALGQVATGEGAEHLEEQLITTSLLTNRICHQSNFHSVRTSPGNCI